MGLHHDHSHDHGHSHHHGHHSNKKSLFLSLCIITTFLIIEVIGGIMTNSLALLSDAGHMLSDSSALLFSLIALHFASRPASPTKTFGFYRFEILAALFNGVTLLLVSIYIFWEAYQRLLAPPEVASLPMIGIAVIGLLANIAAAFVLMRGDYKNNLNLRSAFLHVLGDMLGSVGAIVAGILMWLFGWYIADPIISIVVGLLIIVSAWRVTKESVNILMEGVPSSIDAEKVKAALHDISGVIATHDLHIWTLTSGFHSLSCHLLVEDGLPSYKILNESIKMLEQKFHITHVTIQIEDSSVHHTELACQNQTKHHNHDDDHDHDLKHKHGHDHSH